MMDPQHLVSRLASLRAGRSNFDTQWEEASERVLPQYKSTFLSRGSAQIAPGLKNTELQFDATTAFAAQRFSAVMESLITPQNSIWHLFKSIDPVLKRNRAVRIFFDELGETLFSYRYRPVANFVGNSQQVYLALGVYGNGSLYVDQPDKQRGLRYRNIHLAESYFDVNHAGIIDTVYRAFFLTARQVVQQFGASAPEVARDAAANPQQVDRKFEILHCVYPRDDHMPGRVDGPGKPWASTYLDVDTKQTLRDGGYDSFPYAVARYTQVSGEIYGRGPAQWVLPSIKVLNEQKKTMLEQGHRALAPVYLAHDDGNLGSYSMKPGFLNPGGVNKDGKALVHALPPGNIALGDKMMDMEKAVIHDAFLITLFQILIDTPQMTATEVLERAREKGMLLAPTAGRLQAEFLGPLIEREVDVLARQGLLPEMPQMLQDAAAEYRIEYDSPMSRMQRAEKAAGYMRALGDAAEYAKMTGDLDPIDWFDMDAATPAILDIRGAPVAWTRSLEDVLARREARAQAQQAQQMIEAAPSAASVVKTVASATKG